MGGKKRSGFFFRWMKSDLPDREESPPSVLLLAVRQPHECHTLPHSKPYSCVESSHHVDDSKDILSQLNKRFRKTLSLDSRQHHGINVDEASRPVSMVNYHIPPDTGGKETKTKTKRRLRPKSFFSLETFLRSEDVDSTPKNSRFYLDVNGSTAPVLLDEEIRCKKRLDKLENHFNKIQKLKGTAAAVATDHRTTIDPIRLPIDTELSDENSTTASQSTLVCRNLPTDEDVGRLRSKNADRPRYDIMSQRQQHIESLTNSSCCSHSKFGTSAICCKERTPSSAYEIRITEEDSLINDRTKCLIVKTMDKSVDSIGSCSLDVDADNTDFSDTTSGSLNILTPSSTTSHYKDFTTKLHERATPGFYSNIRGQPLTEEKFYDQEISAHTKNKGSQNPLAPHKKPSYLHLACSINGYSNLTTYDSTLRQKLNKSREHSPARLGQISSFMLRNYPDEAMAAQKLNAPTANGTGVNSNAAYFKSSFSETSISSQNVITYLKSNGTTETHTSKSYNVIANGTGESPSKSFIQQRVERLYGPGALAQGFLNQKRYNDQRFSNGDGKKSVLSPPQSRYSVTEHVKKTHNGNTSEHFYSESASGTEDDPESVLPVLRHLRAEFRAQLPLLSPKRSPHSKVPTPEPPLPSEDVVDRVNFAHSNGKENSGSVVTVIPIVKSQSSNASSNGDVVPKTVVTSNIDDNVQIVTQTITLDTSQDGSNGTYDDIPVIKSQNEAKKNGCSSGADLPVNIDIIPNRLEDGNDFLELCRSEMDRLEQLAKLAEKDLDEIKNNPDVSEDVLGFLRVAAGKARLLASEKMKQFEGLCFKNLNSQPDNKFPTTMGDLRGFWDMVYLQIEDIRVLFEQINEMKKSDWKEIPTIKRTTDATSTTKSTPRVQGTSKKQKPEANPTPKATALSKKRDEQRRALIEAKRRAAAAKASTDTSVEIFSSPPPPKEETS